MQKVINDIPASFVVFLVALPLCMGIAIASGVPPALGLITGIVGGIVAGTFAGAPLQVSGPAAGLTVLVFQLVDEYGVGALGPVVVVAGICQVAAGSARIGQWFRAVNPAVIYGMLSGIGVLIISSQIHIAFDHKPGGSPIENVALIPKVVANIFTNSETLIAGAVGVFSLVILFGWDRFKPKALATVPSALLAVVIATVVAYLFKLPIDYVNLPTNFADSLNIPTAEKWALLLDSSVFTAAIGLAVIASAETLLCASALRKMRSDAEVHYNKELVAQGIGNTICGLLGALPMTGVIVRSTANISANAQTRWSAVLHGIWLLMFVLLMPQLLQFIPMASLAAILIYTGCKLINPAIVKNLANYGRPAVGIYFATVLGIVLTDLLTGVLIGFACALVRLMNVISQIKITTAAGDNGYDMEIKGAATFLTLPKLAAAIENIPLDKRVELHFDRIFYIDHACMDLLESHKQQRADAGGELVLDSSRLRFTWQRSEVGTITLPTHEQKEGKDQSLMVSSRSSKKIADPDNKLQTGT